jgi:hypothetical protein
VKSIFLAIYEGAGFGNKIIPGTPEIYTNVIPGVPVKVGRNPSGTIVASTTTDSTGTYYFSNLPADNYTIYTDIPGYPMDSSYHVTVTSNDSISNLDYVVDSNSVHLVIDVGFSETKAQTPVYTVYPNPTKGNINIHFVNGAVDEVVRIYDLSGRVMYTSKFHSKYSNSVYTFDISESGISTGVYLLELQNCGKKFKINFMRE